VKHAVLLDFWETALMQAKCEDARAILEDLFWLGFNAGFDEGLTEGANNERHTEGSTGA
jgi:hypothetical protein